MVNNMPMSQTTYHTATRDDIIDLSATFARAARPLLEASPDNPVMIRIEGDYASGKSLIFDAMKAALLGKNAVEAARWKHVENTDGYINSKSATISFVNARLDFINAQLAHALNTRSFREGFLFATNLPRFTIGKLLTGAQFPPPAMKINIRFAEGEPRPHQLGPFKWGSHGPIGNRVITCEGP